MSIQQSSFKSVCLPILNVSRIDPGSGSGCVDSWQGYLVEVAYHLRQVAATDPHVLDALVPLVATGWSVSPQLGGLVFVEDFLAAMTKYGFSEEDTAAIFLAFFTRVLGLLIIQSPKRSTPIPDSTDDSAYPTLTRLRPWLTAYEEKTGFEDTLDDVLTSLERDFTPNPRRPRAFAVSNDHLRAWTE